MVITIKSSPRGNFYRAEQGSLCAFDRDRKVAMRKLIEAIWRCGAANDAGRNSQGAA